ncbi:DUF1428 family protein [Streptomyces rubiginosohelvolus]|uniref:DUF1428 family protein n=1 Tax=Streptomyces rubiginosohelvolus TaxID=67362 RepID=UPI003432AA76
MDITIVPVLNDRKAIYLEFSRRMAAIYREHGAARIVDYWQSGPSASQDDFHADGASYSPGELRGIASVVGASDRESVVVTITEWPSKGIRDRGVAAATKDERVRATLDEDPVFDGRRLVAESFEVALSTPGEG